jgi:hypothetical protein
MRLLIRIAPFLVSGAAPLYFATQMQEVSDAACERALKQYIDKCTVDVPPRVFDSFLLSSFLNCITCYNSVFVILGDHRFDSLRG